MSTHSAECCPHNCLEIETSKRAPSMNAMYGRTMIRKTSLLRKIDPIARRSSFAKKIIYNSLTHLAMSYDASAEMIWRLRMRFRKLLCRSQTRIDLLFTMSDITHVAVHPDSACEVMFRGRLFVRHSSIFDFIWWSQTGSNRRPHACKEAFSIFDFIWWSQTGSNRRPHACKARALPAELWPRTRRRMLRTRSKWWAWEDLNFRPHAYQARALTN